MKKPGKHGNLWIFSVIIPPLKRLVIASFTFGPLILPPNATAAPLPKPPSSSAPAEKIQEIPVTLFGQPCTMSGPFPRPVLTSIHEVSPEKISPTAGVEAMKRIRLKTTALKNIPPVLEQYRDHLRKRLAAKIALEEALTQAKKANSSDVRSALDSLLKNLKEHISSLSYPAFEESMKKAFDANGAGWNTVFVDHLREKFERLIQPDTEEEFHKAIRVAKIQYVCSLDEGTESSSNEEGE